MITKQIVLLENIGKVSDRLSRLYSNLKSFRPTESEFQNLLRTIDSLQLSIDSMIAMTGNPKSVVEPSEPDSDRLTRSQVNYLLQLKREEKEAEEDGIPFKSLEEIEELRNAWREDGVWDIWQTDGFERHKRELYLYYLKCEKEWEEERQQELLNKALKIGAPGNISLAQAFERLEQKISRLDRNTERRLCYLENHENRS